MDDKKILITVSIYPTGKDGVRLVIVTGAPEGELPIAYHGAFSEIHQMIDRAWIEINTRKPLVVKSATKKAGETESPEHETAEPEKLGQDELPQAEVGDGDAA